MVSVASDTQACLEETGDVVVAVACPPKRIAYISGPYRHYTADGEFDQEKMQAELQDEMRWAAVVAELGHAWIAPLANSAPLETRTNLLAEDYIERDLQILDAMSYVPSLLIVRSGAFDTCRDSLGVDAEVSKAHSLCIPVVWLDSPEEIVDAIKELDAICATMEDIE